MIPIKDLGKGVEILGKVIQNFDTYEVLKTIFGEKIEEYVLSKTSKWTLNKKKKATKKFVSELGNKITSETITTYLNNFYEEFSIPLANLIKSNTLKHNYETDTGSIYCLPRTVLKYLIHKKLELDLINSDEFERITSNNILKTKLIDEIILELENGFYKAINKSKDGIAINDSYSLVGVDSEFSWIVSELGHYYIFIDFSFGKLKDKELIQARNGMLTKFQSDLAKMQKDEKKKSLVKLREYIDRNNRKMNDAT